MLAEQRRQSESGCHPRCPRCDDVMFVERLDENLMCLTCGHRDYSVTATRREPSEILHYTLIRYGGTSGQLKDLLLRVRAKNDAWTCRTMGNLIVLCPFCQAPMEFIKNRYSVMRKGIRVRATAETGIELYGCPAGHRITIRPAAGAFAAEDRIWL